MVWVAWVARNRWPRQWLARPCVECDPRRIQMRLDTRYLDNAPTRSTLAMIANAASTVVGIGWLPSSTAEMFPELLRRTNAGRSMRGLIWSPTRPARTIR